MNYGQGQEADGAQRGEVAAGGPGHDQDYCGKEVQTWPPRGSAGEPRSLLAR